MGKRAHGEGTISRRKDGTWEGKISLGYGTDGKRKRKTVYGRTQAEVREKLERVKREVADGTFTDAKLNVADYLRQWLAEAKRTVKPGTLEQYVYCVESHIKPRVGTVRLDKLTPLQVQRMVGDIADSIAKSGRGKGVSTANKCRVVLYMAYKQAIRWQMVARNPVEAVDPLPETKREMTLWEPEQAARFLDVARAHRLYACFYLAMATGMRRGELLGLRWQDVQGDLIRVRQTLVKLKDGTVTLGTPKTKKGTRVIAVSPDVVQVLGLHRQQQDAERAQLERAGLPWPDHDLVFTSEVGTPINPDNFRRVRNELMDKADVPRVRLHDLRHLHASMAIKNGMDPKMLADRLGQSRASFTLDEYTHIWEAQRAKAVVNISEWLKEKRDGPALN